MFLSGITCLTKLSNITGVTLIPGVGPACIWQTENRPTTKKCFHQVWIARDSNFVSSDSWHKGFPWK